ncbi:FecR family protein [Polaribacter sargassicola]|uniref:FecR family protein n=1 Tax=Polaribacter sargassicola TaxID=2836891 RepID=UPI001F4090C4|nr:FecR family protein [Polaribacter sp. DS7-9]MCG1036822.1 FecR domain-containing protein [Polaribacter sp. DS7-9]
MARWLDNRLNDTEKIELEKSGELDALKSVLDDIDTWKVEKMDIDKGLKDLKARKKHVIAPTSLKQKKKISWLSIAASLLLLISAGYFMFLNFNNQTTTITTDIAENKKITLPDGTIIKMDALSSVSYEKKDWKNNRVVTLDGQAFFDVIKGNPFKVITKTGQINVLGTQFNVNNNKNIFEVVCYEGKVEVVYKTDIKILTKGQWVTAKQDKLVNYTHDKSVPEWINGFSKYNKTNLLNVINDLEKYYNVQINLPKKYHLLEFTGTLTHKDLNTALQTLFTSMEIKYSIDKNNTVTFN